MFVKIVLEGFLKIRLIVNLKFLVKKLLVVLLIFV